MIAAAREFKKVGVIAGGRLHREYALASARTVQEALIARGYNVDLLDTQSRDFPDRSRGIDAAFLAQFGMHGDRRLSKRHLSRPSKWVSDDRGCHWRFFRPRPHKHRSRLRNRELVADQAHSSLHN